VSKLTLRVSLSNPFTIKDMKNALSELDKHVKEQFKWSYDNEDEEEGDTYSITAYSDSNIICLQATKNLEQSDE
jgi:hypothetical protein